jgi:hypothetical protein
MLWGLLPPGQAGSSGAVAGTVGLDDRVRHENRFSLLPASDSSRDPKDPGDVRETHPSTVNPMLRAVPAMMLVA